MKRSVTASRDTYEKMKRAKQDKLTVYSFFPVDPYSCPCQIEIENWKDKLSLMSEQERAKEIDKITHLECPRDKSGLIKYEIRCRSCNQVQGYCWATDASLKDWCDFHYVQWTNGNEWFGCLTPNISPISGQLTLECTCGQDTRDFRANQTIPLKKAMLIEESNREGREFNKKGSKFKVKPIQVSMKPDFNTKIIKKAPTIIGREIT